MADALRIAAIGARGDGVAETPDGPVYVPFTVPGDVVRVRVGRDRHARVVKRLEDGPARHEPACAHFGVCGGCALQHVDDAFYAGWKRDLVVQALRRRGLEAEVGLLVRLPPGARRRVRLSARAMETVTVLGFRERRSHRLVEVSECPVAAPEIVHLFVPLRALLGDILPRRSDAEVTVTALAAGLDVLILARGEPGLAERERLGDFAQGEDLARLSWMTSPAMAEPVAARRPVRAAFAGIAVDVPPASFLQPTEAGEESLRDEVVRALAGGRRVADLFAGCGAFGLPLAAAGSTLTAADSDEPALTALAAAARRAGFGGHVSVETRDLERRPLSSAEMAEFDCAVLDPPRAGAARQAAEFAASRVPAIAYVSCNPSTFARDARTLVDGGYGLERVTPVDQFLWSPHVELVGVFRR